MMISGKSALESGGYLLLLSLIILGLSSTVSQATLSERDFSTPGDGLLLFDSDTDLEWLDLTETDNLSYNDLIDGTVGPIDFINDFGFRFATTDEVAVLWEHAGIVDTTGTLTTGNRVGVEYLLDTMGCIFLCGTASETVQAQAEFSPTQSILNGPFMQLGSGDRARAKLNEPLAAGRDFSNEGLGSYLVRTAVVPEPSTAVLLGLGFAALATRRRPSR